MKNRLKKLMELLSPKSQFWDLKRNLLKIFFDEFEFFVVILLFKIFITLFRNFNPEIVKQNFNSNPYNLNHEGPNF